MYINLEEGLSRIRGNKALYARMLGMFLDNKEAGMLEESLAGGDLAGAGHIAHAIKWMTGNLSLTLLFETSTALMESLHEGKRDEAIISAYRDALEKTIEKAAQLKGQLEAELET